MFASNKALQAEYAAFIEAEAKQTNGAQKIKSILEDAGNLPSSFNSFSNTIKGVHYRLAIGGVKFSSNGNTISYLTKTGEVLAKLENGSFSVNKLKPDIQLPSTYLDAAYITNHINKFNQEGGAFIIRLRDLSNPNYATIAPRKFIGLKSEMDAVITKFNKSGKDLNVLVEELDLGNYFKPGDEVFYVTVEGNKGFVFDIPNGNEGGAYAGYWVPGGYTKHGTREVVISNAESFSHNNSLQTFINIFGTNNVLKIH